MHGLKGLCLYFSVWVGLSSCQTPAKDANVPDKEQQLVNSEKAIIRNALDSGKPESALAELRGLLRDHPNDPSLQSLMGLMQLALKNGPRAVKYLQSAYRLDHSVANGLNLSSALTEVGDYDRAVRLLQQLAKLADAENYPYKERIYHNLGYSYLRQNRLTKAEQWLHQATDENPTFFPSVLELARIYERTNRPAMAQKAYRRSMDYCIVCFEPVQALAQIYLKQGKPLDARRMLFDFAKIEGISPGDRTRANQLLTNLTPGSPPTPADRMTQTGPQRGAASLPATDSHL